ncbi:GntR family transcriptional regulator [Actinomycetes bacterium KLBMP 9797]
MRPADLERAGSWLALRAQLARQIQDHTLAVGTRLPTIRRLAADLGLAVNTVGRAYRELEEAGLIETRGPAGSFVSAAGEKGRERASRAAAEYAGSAGEASELVRVALHTYAGDPLAVEVEADRPGRLPVD